MKTTHFAAALACLTASANMANAVTTELVTETYALEANEFFYFSNFWEGRGPNVTDASTPVPVERVAMTFELMYFTPIEQASATRNAAVSFDITDLEFVTRDVAGLSIAETQTEADIEQESAYLRTRPSGDNQLQFGADFDDHGFDVWIYDFTAFAAGGVPDSSIFQIDIDSLQSFDSPDYRALPQDWSVELLSSTSVPSAIPLPAGGWLLLSALGFGGLMAQRQRAAVQSTGVT